MDKKELKTVMEKEIDLVQGCISRMAQNSFVIKGWTITLIAVALVAVFEMEFLHNQSLPMKSRRLYIHTYIAQIEKQFEMDIHSNLDVSTTIYLPQEEISHFRMFL